MKTLTSFVLTISLICLPVLVQAQSFGKQTYAASTAAKTTITTAFSPFFSICGSSTKTIRVRQIIVDFTVATTAVHASPILQKTSTATASGTAVALTAVPLDSSYAAATVNLLNSYTAPPTTGTVVGTVAGQMVWGQVTATVTGGSMQPRAFIFRSQNESDAIVLRGTTQCVQAAFGDSPGNNVTYMVSVLWTEE